MSHIGFVSAQSFALGQQEVAGKPVFDGNGVAHLAQFGDALEENYVHCFCPLIVVYLFEVEPAAKRDRNWKRVSATPRTASTGAMKRENKSII